MVLVRSSPPREGGTPHDCTAHDVAITIRRMTRHENRLPGQLRSIRIQRRFTRNAGGSVLISFGQTQVLCTAMLERDLPPWLKAKGPGGGGWLTAEYAMLPSSTTTRKRRDS